MERPKVTYTGEFDTFDRDEIERLVVAAENEQDAAIYRVAAFTGLRMGELLALRWSDVDFVDGLLLVRRNFTGGTEKVPKGKRVRSVPMMPAVIDTRAISRTGRASPVPMISSSPAITKLDPHAVQSCMGHQHYSTTQRYLHHQA